jgi:hypothetical protein
MAANERVPLRQVPDLQQESQTCGSPCEPQVADLRLADLRLAKTARLCLPRRRAASGRLILARALLFRPYAVALLYSKIKVLQCASPATHTTQHMRCGR